MAAAKLAPRDMPARHQVPAGSLSAQGLAAGANGLVYDDKEKAIAIEGHQVLPAAANRLFARPRRMVGLRRYKFVMRPASMSIRLKWRASAPPAHA